MDRSFRQKINKKTLELNNTSNQMYLTDICRIFHSTVQNIHFSSVTETLSYTDHRLRNKLCLSIYKKSEIISNKICFQTTIN
jgi:bifunctional N-acetylglucosamine-1-phosphate-uridyltransferase/glucosamine-1-phosphate-acetyltransferase GlmU-like protein